MTEPTINDLADRLSRLERQNARLKGVGAVASVALILAVGLGAMAEQGESKRGTAVKALRAKGFVAVDGQDRDLVHIGTEVDPKSGGLIEFLDKGGRRRLALGIGENDVPFVSLIDPVRNEQVSLNLDPEKGLALSFRNRKANSAMVLGLGPEGNPSLGFMGPGGKIAMNLGLNADGSGLVILRDKDGQETQRIPAP